MRNPAPSFGVACFLSAFFFLPQVAWAENDSGAFGLRTAVGASIDRGGMALGVGSLWNVRDPLRLGMTLEWNPWFDAVSLGTSPGVLNAYVSLHWVLLRGEGFEVRASGHVGASLLLFDALGAPANSLGVFLGASLFNVAWKLHPRWSLEVSPEVVLPVPSLGGVPFVYLQYRVMLGVVRW